MGDGPFIDRVGGSSFYPGQVPDPVSPPGPTVTPSATEPGAANTWQQESNGPDGSRPWLSGNVAPSAGLGKLALVLTTVAALVLVPFFIWLSHRGDETPTATDAPGQTFTAQGLASLMPGLKTVSAPGVPLHTIPTAPSSIRLQIQGDPGVKVDITLRGGEVSTDYTIRYPQASLPFTLDLPAPFPKGRPVYVYADSADYQNPPNLQCTLTVDGVVVQSDVGVGSVSCTASAYVLNPR